jgi:hypothetical protein
LIVLPFDLTSLDSARDRQDREGVPTRGGVGMENGFLVVVCIATAQFAAYQQDEKFVGYLL